MAKWRQIALPIGLLLIALLSAQAEAADNLPEQFVEQAVLTGLDQPVNLVALPDGRMLVLEKAGAVKLFNPATVPATTSTVLSVAPVQTRGERGLASIALDPRFASNGFFYLYYTQQGNDGRNRLSRFQFDFGSSGATGNEVLVWEDNEPAIDCCHYGGGLDFGPDGMLYLATGEEFDGPQAQDLSRAGGKLIRLDVSALDSVGPWQRDQANDHIIPDDNPFIDGAGGNLDEVWAYGLRNPFRMHWDLAANRLYIGEVGGNIQNTAREDLHVGRRGANYGWPACEGPCDDPAFDDPIYSYPHTGATPLGGAIAAGVVYRASRFPADFQGAFFFADYATGFIKYLLLNGTGGVASVNDFATDAGSVVAMETGADGALYVVDYAGNRVVRFSYDGGDQLPVVSSATASVTSGPAPLSVAFSALATDPEGDPLTYTWTFGDGTTATGANVTKTYAAAGAYTAFVAVSDADGVTNSEEIAIQVGVAPVAAISAPVDGDTFVAGQEIAYAASVADGETDLAYRWTVDFFHNAHVHPALTSTEPGGTLEVPESGHDFHDDTGYQFNLTVTNGAGLSTTSSVRVRPRKVDLNLATLPAGLPVTIDGLPLDTPLAYDTVTNFRHAITVPETVCEAGTGYSFTGWSNGEPRTHLLTVGADSIALVATYRADGACTELPVDDDPGALPADLVLRLESDQGVVEEAGTVVGWGDQSGVGNDLSALGDPALTPNGLNGLPVLSFDGVEDRLQSEGAAAGLPGGASDRTAYLVANYIGTGFGGFSYGRAQPNQTFGLVVDDAGALNVQGWGAANDFPADSPGTGAGWLVQSAVLQDNVLTQSLNGAVIDTQNHLFDTQSPQLVLGAEISGTPQVDMQVAAVLLFDRALTAEEQQQVQTYLQAKYFGADGGAAAAVVASNDSVTTLAGFVADIDILANDTIPDESGVPIISLTQPPVAGSVSIDAANGRLRYVGNGSSAADLITYTLLDGTGESNEAIVTVTLDSWPSLPVGSLPFRQDGARLPAAAGPDSATPLANRAAGQAAVTRSPEHAGEASAAGHLAHDAAAAGVDHHAHEAGAHDHREQAQGLDDIDSPTARHPLPDEGLVVHLKASDSVTESGDRVVAWADSFSTQRRLVSGQGVQLVPNALNGMPVLDFDGRTGLMTGTEPWDILPTGSSDRSVYAVVLYEDTADGGVTYGQLMPETGFGLGSEARYGTLSVRTPYAPEADDAMPGVLAGDGSWRVQGVVLEAGELTHTDNGSVIGGRQRATLDTATGPLVIGADLAGQHFVDLQIAEVLVYDRALSVAEQTQLQDHFARKYRLGMP